MAPSTESQTNRPDSALPDASVEEPERGERAEDAPAILLVEDDETLAMTVRYNLQKLGFPVTVAGDGLQGVRTARFQRPALIVLDLMLPRIEGLEVCRLLRTWTSAPILVLTAVDDERTVVEAFESGADDYVTKPFHMSELVARVRALLRRAAGPAHGAETLVAGDLVLDLKAYRATFAGRELRLPPKEFRLLTVLVRQPQTVFTRLELIRLVWGEDVVVDPRNVDVHVRAIRAQLEGDPDGSLLIQTVHGVGYRFAGELGPPAA